MEGYSRAEAAARAGASLDDVGVMVEQGILTPGEDDRFSIGDVQRIGLVRSFVAAGMSQEGLAEAMHRGSLSLAFLDSPVYARFPTLSAVTFRELSAETGVSVELLMVIREAIGAAMPTPDERVRDDELQIVPLVRAQVESGIAHPIIERALHAIGDSLRRVAEVEADWFRTEVIEPRVAGRKGAEIAQIAAEFSERFTPLNRKALLAIYQAHQANALIDNMLGGFEEALTEAGLSTRLARPAAMCFLDISGYTRLTEERGDEAAASLAEQLNRLVHRVSVQHGGRPVKWLGDGVMFHFREPEPAVLAALEMVEGVGYAGLPPAHVGIDAGPVIFREGDYYGKTVNVASRIAEYARPGEVVVSQAVVDASGDAAVRYRLIGPVELKGVAGAMRLHVASPGGTGRAG
jgi:adenylate cyclase